jgi:L-alanine-DL-glutamate epimerase-like enolase superfamily enzyme
VSLSLERFQITRIQYPRNRVIGDSQVRFNMHYNGALELFTANDLVGLGFFQTLGAALPPLDELIRTFESGPWQALRGQNPVELLNRLSRPRGGNIQPQFYGQAMNQALWDIHGKEMGLPLYRLLGGTDPRVRAYASGLEFHLSLDAACAFFAEAARQGFSAFKMKIGHPDLAWDLQRLTTIAQVVGPDAVLMVDANEAWSPKEAIRRAHAYRDAGLHIYWIEDPCLRDDFAGLAMVAQEVPFTHINSGEYLDLHGKRLLMEHRAVDILNIHGQISDSLHAAWLAAEYGIPVSLGNTNFELGVHLAAAFPHAEWIEYSFQDYNQLVEHPVVFEGGYAIAPERPGHGLTLSEAARTEYARPLP